MSNPSTPGQKRVFFALEVQAPWPQDLPEGRIIDEDHRHITLAFLGNIDYTRLEPLLADFPRPSFKIGFVGQFDKSLALPPTKKNVIAWHAVFPEGEQQLFDYQKEIVSWLRGHDYDIQERDFLAHATIARRPFIPRQWKQGLTRMKIIKY